MPGRYSRLFLALVAIEALIVAIHLGTLVAAYGFGRDWLFGLNVLFDLDEELNVPAFFSFAILLTAAVLLTRVALKRAVAHTSQAYWFGLALAFLYMASDEMLEVHERVGRVVADLLGGGDITNYAWLIPYGAVTLIVGATYIRFLKQLPAWVRAQFLIAGGIYICGAIGMEFLGGVYVHFNHTEQTFAYDLLSATEETLEMFGVIWFINSLTLILEKNSAPAANRRSAVPQTEGSAST